MAKTGKRKHQARNARMHKKKREQNLPIAFAIVGVVFKSF